MRKRHQARDGFTLVELLVVITIIGMLMAMMLPALGQIIAKFDIVTCTNRQEEIGKAILAYTNAKDKFPGYQTRIMTGAGSSGRNPELRSWIVVTLETLNKDNYDAIRRKQDNQPKYLKTFQCPSSGKAADESISFVANCGRKDGQATNTIPADWKTNGVFMRENLKTTGSVREERVTLADIVTANRTLLISENLQATRWTDMGEPDVGMVWFAESNESLPQPESKRINIDKEVQLAKGDYNYARPSSNHPDGVVVVFCGGNSMFLSDRVEYGAVYCKLMMTKGRDAKEPGQNTLTKEFYRKPLKEELLLGPQ